MRTLMEGQGFEVRQLSVLTNKLLELTAFPHWTRHWPYWAWFACDWLCNRIIRKPAFLLALATRNS